MTEEIKQENTIPESTPTPTPTKKKPKGRKSAKKGEQKVQEKRDVGRPTVYSEDLANKILLRISEGESLLTICKDDDMPSRSTVHAWILDEKYKDFSDKYTRARELQAEYLFDETIEIADNSIEDIVGDDKSDSARINSRRLQVDTRKFYISKVLPKKYGAKVDVTSDGEKLEGNSIIFIDAGEVEEQDHETTAESN